MFKSATAALAALIASSALTGAMAATATVKAGQYYGVTQYTSVTDVQTVTLGGLTVGCEQLGIAQGNLNTSVATVVGLGSAWSQTIADTNPTIVSQYGVSWANCQFPAMPAATAFKENILNKTPLIVDFTSSPAGSQTTACLSSSGASYTLQSNNGTASDGTVQTALWTVIPLQSKSGNYSYKVTLGNALLSIALPAAVGGGTVSCYVNIDTLYSNTKV